MDGAGPGAAGEGVGAGTAGDHVVAGPTVKAIVTGAAGDRVVPAHAENDVVEASAREVVGAARSDDVPTAPVRRDARDRLGRVGLHDEIAVAVRRRDGDAERVPDIRGGREVDDLRR